MKPPADHSFVDHVLDQLDGFAVVPRAMFGGHGLYHGETFFALVYGGRLYFRCDDFARPEFERRGMGPFKPGIARPMRSFYEVPPEVLEDAAELQNWAARAVRSRSDT